MLVEIAEKTQFLGFSGEVESGAWRSRKKGSQRKSCALEDQELGRVIDCDQSRSENGNPD
jgi:hypothetical protein